MNWKLICHAAWHGLGAALITGATVVVTYRQAPQGWDMVILLIGLGVSFWKGANSYNTIPSDL